MKRCDQREHHEGVTQIGIDVYELKDRKSKYLIRLVNPNDFKIYWFLIGYSKKKLVTFLPLRMAFWFASALPDKVNEEIWYQYISQIPQHGETDLL